MDQSKVTVNIPEGFDPSKPIVILFGEHNKPVDLKGFAYEGNIDSVSRFLAVNEGNVKKEQAIIVMDFDKKSIVLDTDPANPQNRKISGSMKSNPDIAKIGINDSEKRYQILVLKNTLRRLPHLFESNEEYVSTLKTLDELRVSVTVDHTQAGDNKGNLELALKKLTNIKENPSFKLKMPVYSGYESEVFRVEICFDVTSSQVNLYLESTELIILENQIQEEKFNAEKEQFSSYVVIRK